MSAAAKTILAGVGMLLVLAGIWGQARADLPRGLLVVAYDGSGWYPYVVAEEGGDWSKIEAIRNPHHATLSARAGQLFVKDEAGRLYRYVLATGETTPLKALGDGTYTQLRAHETGLALVELLDGKSRDTRLLVLDDSLNVEARLQQGSAQFHPLMRNEALFYAHVSCRLECEPLIQEVWRKDRTSGKVEQITLLNATTYLHSVDGTGGYGFLSSNRRGYYHLARLDLASGEVAWLTEGRVTDSFPSVAANGDVYFIRRTADGSRLMKLPSGAPVSGVSPAEAKPVAVALPGEVTKIRYLELNH